MSIAVARLAVERRCWRKNHPWGFVAKPEMASDGSVNLMVWQCTIPGEAGTDWEGRYFPLTVLFNENYPMEPPECKFPQGFFHPNVYPSGSVCMPLLDDDGVWHPALTLKHILLGIQDLLSKPNLANPAHMGACRLYLQNPIDYNRRVKQQVREFPLMY